MFYQCMLDNSQLLKILSIDKNTAHVGVYYKTKDLNKDPQYVGKSTRPASLFSDDLHNKRIGFLPWDRESELERIRRAKAYQEAKLRRRYDEESDD